MDGRKYSNDDDVLRVLRAIMAPFYHDYRAAILHATRRRYSSLRFPLRPPLPPRSPPSSTSPHFLTFASCVISARGTAILSSTIATLAPLVEWYLHRQSTLNALFPNGGCPHPRFSKTTPVDAIRICHASATFRSSGRNPRVEGC